MTYEILLTRISSRAIGVVLCDRQPDRALGDARVGPGRKGAAPRSKTRPCHPRCLADMVAGRLRATLVGVRPGAGAVVESGHAAVRAQRSRSSALPCRFGTALFRSPPTSQTTSDAVVPAMQLAWCFRVATALWFVAWSAGLLLGDARAFRRRFWRRPLVCSVCHRLCCFQSACDKLAVSRLSIGTAQSGHASRNRSTDRDYVSRFSNK